VVSLPPQASSPVQLLITNDGVAPAMITLSLRSDPPAPEPAPAVILDNAPNPPDSRPDVDGEPGDPPPPPPAAPQPSSP
jgi:serine/threonine-protein kinase